MCSRNIYLVLIFFAGVWPVSASELSSKLPAFPSFRSGSCCCSISAMAHKHSSSLWGVQSCCGSTEEEGKLIFKTHHENGVGGEMVPRGWSNDLKPFLKSIVLQHKADGTFCATSITSVQVLCLLNHFVQIECVVLGGVLDGL